MSRMQIKYISDLDVTDFLRLPDTFYMTAASGTAPVKEHQGLRMAGLIVAGFPSPAEEELRDVISFDDYLVQHPQASFILRVSGDSMTGAGIMPGDLVIVEKGREPKNGQIVIAEVDGEWTMKYFYKTSGQVRLEAANPAYPVIRPRMELRLVGLVTACIRKYTL